MRSELIIDLKKLDHNVDVIKSTAQNNPQIMAVIKDDAYGHGAVEIARHISAKVDWFCVATLEEGIELREAKIENPILIYEVPDAELIDQFNAYDLTVSVSDMQDFDLLIPGINYQINFDTGMRRLGIPASKAKEAVQRTQELNQNICTGIYTHFSSADEPENESVTAQLKTFTEVCAQFPASMYVHSSNSGGIFHYGNKNAHLKGIRPGICLYGYSAGATEIKNLKPIMSWKSHIMQLRNVEKGDSVGYGQSWSAPSAGIVGTIPVGYGDGLSRALSGKISFSINGKLYQQVGRISMDYCEVYSADEHAFSRKDEVFLLDGNTLTAKYWADKIDTIAYEITTRIHPKVKKTYLK